MDRYMNRKRLLFVFVVATFLIACVKKSFPGTTLDNNAYIKVSIRGDAEPFKNCPYDNNNAKSRTS